MTVYILIFRALLSTQTVPKKPDALWAGCLVHRIRLRAVTVLFTYAAALLLCFTALADTVAAPEEDACEAFPWTLLRLEVDDASGADVITAPPPGTYVFHRGDMVLLRAYDQYHRPLVVGWSGDASKTGAHLKLNMDTDVTLSVSAGATESNKAADMSDPPWFDVPDDRGVFTFLGGGRLYGWFGARRDKDHGAGITHLTHDAYPHAPLWHGVSLGLEHVFSGAAADVDRARYTPRMDPMRFQVESPASVRVHWPAEQSAWNMDCEMRYTFAGGDALDMDFAVTPRDESFPREYVVFMWAGYHHRFLAPAIFFPGISGDHMGWTHFGLEESDTGVRGGAVARWGMAPLPVEDGGDNMNLLTSERVFYRLPFYYGLIDSGLTESDREAALRHALTANDAALTTTAEGLMAYVMMFEQEAPVRFALWNWDDPPRVSAWDWQYVLHNPARNCCNDFFARLVYTPFDGADNIKRRYQRWRDVRMKQTQGREHSLCREYGEGISERPGPPLPNLQHYWGPINASAASDALAKAAARTRDAGNLDEAESLFRDAVAIAPTDRWHQVHLAEILESQDRTDEALQLYQAVLRAAPESPYTATRLDALYARLERHEARVAFWQALHNQYPQAETPATHLQYTREDTSNTAANGVVDGKAHPHKAP